MELRKCKECGKMFQPKGREQYCSDIHYRPCPICGEPVIAKYLSDPARKCDKCRGKKTPSASTPAKPTAPTVRPMQMAQKSLFNIKPMTIPGQPKKPESQPAAKAESVDKEETAKLEKLNLVIPERLESAIFCDRATGSTFRFVRSKPLCGFIPKHIYTLKVDRDNAAYIVTSVFDNTLDREINYHDRNVIGMRCTSQLSFYNYFQPVWQGSEEAV